MSNVGSLSDVTFMAKLRNTESPIIDRTRFCDASSLRSRLLRTRAYNRFKIETILSYELERSRRHKTVFSVIIVDIDHFKQVNDTYGHAAGDHVLQEFAEILTQNSRKLDSIGRWGGEEFIIISPETNGDGVKILAEKLRKKVEEHIFDKGLKVTASFGPGALDPKSDWESFFERIDAALYESKENGRNRVTVG